MTINVDDFSTRRGGEIARTCNARLFRIACKLNTVACIAGVVVDMYGLNGTRWDQGARWAYGSSCGGLLIFLHH